MHYGSSHRNCDYHKEQVRFIQTLNKVKINMLDVNNYRFFNRHILDQVKLISAKLLVQNFYLVSQKSKKSFTFSRKQVFVSVKEVKMITDIVDTFEDTIVLFVIKWQLLATIFRQWLFHCCKQVKSLCCVQSSE